MLINLLPGLRELRAPLASGYLWLLSAWLFLGHVDWLPSRRPPGNGEVARLWDLGGTLGKTVVLAAVTFVAYLIGSFLEMTPDGPLARALMRSILSLRQPSYSQPASLIRRYSLVDVDEIGRALKANGIFYDEQKAKRVAQSISKEAKGDLMVALEQRSMLPERIGPYQYEYEPLPTERLSRGQSKSSVRDKMQEWAARHGHALEKEIRNEMAAEMIISEIIGEMQQLASRLLVQNQELYGRYDRQMAEASVRVNVSLPLTVLLILATWLSDLNISLEVGLTVVALGFGFMLMRQGLLRAVSALVIGEVESRYMPTERPAEEPAKLEEPRRDQIKDLPSAQ